MSDDDERDSKARALAGDPSAQVAMGMAAIKTWTPEGEAEGLAWFRKGAEQGHAPAAVHLGVFLTRRGNACLRGRVKSTDPVAEAEALFREAARYDYGPAQYSLARLLTRPGRSESEKSEAEDWFARAVEREEPRA